MTRPDGKLTLDHSSHTHSPMASSPPRSPHLSPAPLKRTRRTLEFSPINYMYQLSCPDRCISKSAAIRNYKVYHLFFLSWNSLNPSTAQRIWFCNPPARKSCAKPTLSNQESVLVPMHRDRGEKFEYLAFLTSWFFKSYIVQRNKITSGATKGVIINPFNCEVWRRNQWLRWRRVVQVPESRVQKSNQEHLRLLKLLEKKSKNSHSIRKTLEGSHCRLLWIRKKINYLSEKVSKSVLAHYSINKIFQSIE